LPSLVAHRQFGEHVGQGCGIEAGFDDVLACSHNPADPGREIVRELMCPKRVFHHRDHPLL